MLFKNVTSLFRCVCFLCLFIYSSTGVSQDYDHLFSTFQYPDVGRKSFRISPALDLYQSKRSYLDNFHRIDFDIDGSYFKNSYTRDRQINTSISFNTGYTHLPDNTITNSDGINGFVNLTNNYLFYDQPKRYLRVWNNLFAGYDNNTFFGATSNLFRNFTTDRTLYLNPEINLGFGRREIVNDLWQAMTIVEVLKKEKAIIKDLTDADIEALTHEISRIKNIRRVDFRHEFIAEQERLISYFLDNGLADLHNPRFYAVLLDAWFYENFATRLNGNATEIGVSGRIAEQVQEIGSDTTFTEFHYGLTTGHYRNRALSKEWQMDQLYDLDAGIYGSRYIKTSTLYKNYYISPSAALRLGYYQSLRTYYTLSLNSRLDLYFPLEENRSDQYNYRIALFGTINHYFSPQLRLRISGNINLIGTDFINTSIHGFNNRTNGLYIDLDYFLF